MISYNHFLRDSNILIVFNSIQEIEEFSILLKNVYKTLIKGFNMEFYLFPEFFGHDKTTIMRPKKIQNISID